MHLIIDGYNLLYADRLKSRTNAAELQQGREQLIRKLSAYRRRKEEPVTIVFDGWQSGWSAEHKDVHGGIEIVFSQRGERADDLIKRMVRDEGSGVLVVSSDREIARYAERMRVPVLSSEQFIVRLERPATTRETTLQKNLEEDDDDERRQNRKGPSRRLSKKEKRLRSALKKM